MIVNMKKIILILFFVMIFVSLVSASGLYPVSMEDLVHPACNNNGRCDYFESSQTCPNECNAETFNTDTVSGETSTTTIISSSYTTIPVINEQINEQVDEINEQSSVVSIIAKQPVKIPWTLILAFGFTIGIIFLVVVLYLWIKGQTKTSKQSENKKRKVRSNNEEDEFGLPSRPKRGFGV